VSFLGDIGNVVSGIAGIAGALGALGADTNTPAPQVNTAAAAQSGAGYRSVFTPSLLLDVGTQDLGFLRTNGLNPDVLESGYRQQIAGIANSFQGLTANPVQNRADLASLRDNLAGLRSRSGELRNDVDAARAQFGTTLGDLAAQVVPGFGRLTESRVQAVNNRRDEAVGNLRESLRRRNVLGSSFAADTITRTELAFAQEEESARAQSIIEELGLSKDFAVTEAVTTGKLAALSGQLLELDSASLIAEAKTIAIDMGLTQQDAGLFAQQLAAIQAEQSSLAQTVARQLQEAGLTANIANAVNAQINGVAQANVEYTLAQAQINAAASQQAGAALAGLGPAIASLGEGLGGIFNG